MALRDHKLYRLARHPATGALVLLALVGGVGAWFVSGTVQPKPARAQAPLPTVEVPPRPVSLPGDAPKVQATLRWGHPAGPADGPRAASQDWSGYVALECGDILRVEPQGLEADGQAPVPDRVGPVVYGDRGDQRVYFRSRVGADWDGVKLLLAACEDPAQPGKLKSSLHIATVQRTYVAKLNFEADDFVSLPLGPDGSSLDVHLTPVRDQRALRGARVTSAPLPPQPPAPMAEADELAPAHSEDDDQRPL